MNCCSPISIPDKHLRLMGVPDAQILVPCGHCVECARDRRNDWFVRLWSHYQRCVEKDVPVWFVTVSIDPKKWPNLNVNCPGVEDRIAPFIRSWKERFRYLNGGTMPVVFLCNEFGSCGRDYVDRNGVVRVTTGALHFHGVIFGDLDIRNIGLGLKATHGYTQFDPIRGPQCIRYVVKYATKDFSIENPCLRARVFTSPGLGDPTYYFGDSPATPIVIINGYHYRTPRYFLERQWIHVYAVYNRVSFDEARKKFIDSLGVSTIVRENVLRRYRNYLEVYPFDLSHGPAFYSYFLSNVISKSRTAHSIDKVKRLFDLKIVGYGHPTLRHCERLSSYLAFCDEIYNDHSFLFNKPIFLKQFYERTQIIVPLSLNFET